MNIYIYGSKNFKKDINKLLSKANIVFKLEDAGTISELKSVEELKSTIVENPRDIFLIDENKIVKKGGVDFLKPKDGIERTFLNQYGVGDLSVDTFDDLVDHINARIELKQSQNEDISTSITSIDIDNLEVDESFQEDSEELLNIDDIDDIDNLEDDKADEIINTEEDDDVIEEDDDVMNIDDIIEDDDNDEIVDDTIEEDIAENTKEENMADDISDLDGLDELDNLDESMLMEALDDPDFEASSTETKEEVLAQNSSDNLTLDASQLGALTEVLSKLLDGKELEITIKVK